MFEHIGGHLMKMAGNYFYEYPSDVLTDVQKDIRTDIRTDVRPEIEFTKRPKSLFCKMHPPPLPGGFREDIPNSSRAVLGLCEAVCCLLSVLGVL